MSASVPSEEASNPVQDVANQIAKAFRENTTPEKIDVSLTKMFLCYTLVEGIQIVVSFFRIGPLINKFG